MSQDDRTQAPLKKGGGGLLGRIFGRGEDSASQTDSHSALNDKSTLNLDDIQGFILRGYRMPMVRHFLLTVGVPTQARKLLGRFVNGDESARARARGQSRRSSAPQARLLPECGYHLAWTDCVGDQRSRAHARVQVIRRIHRRSS